MRNKAFEDQKYKKGKSGNPGGRTPGSKTFNGALKKLLDSTEMEIIYTNGTKKKHKIKIVLEGKKNSDVTLYDAIAAKQIEMAVKGDTRAAKEIIDRMEGKAKQSIDMKTELSGELKLSVEKRVIRSRADIKRPVSRETITTVTESVETEFDLDEII